MLLSRARSSRRCTRLKRRPPCWPRSVTSWACPTLAKNFVGVVAVNRRAGELPSIAKSFADKAAKHRGASRVTARVAKPISKDQTLDLESAVSKALGRTVTVDVEVDPALIGGLQLKMGSRLVDASIRTKLNNLTNLMKGA